MEEIRSRANPRIKEIASLKKNPTSDRFLIEGYHLCEMAREAGCLMEVYAAKPVDFPNVKAYLVTPEIIEKLASSKTPEGIVGVAKAPSFSKSEEERVLILDRVQDPGNVGTLLRSALSFGFSAVYFLKGSALPNSAKALASSQGAYFHLRTETGLEGKSLLSRLKQEGYEILGSSLSNAMPLPDNEPKAKKIALILGNEGQGIDKELLSLTDHNLFIPISGIDSLNVAVAGGILMYHLRQEGKV